MIQKKKEPPELFEIFNPDKAIEKEQITYKDIKVESSKSAPQPQPQADVADTHRNSGEKIINMRLNTAILLFIFALAACFGSFAIGYDVGRDKIIRQNSKNPNLPPAKITSNISLPVSPPIEKSNIKPNSKKSDQNGKKEQPKDSSAMPPELTTYWTILMVYYENSLAGRGSSQYMIGKLKGKLYELLAEKKISASAGNVFEKEITIRGKKQICVCIGKYIDIKTDVAKSDLKELRKIRKDAEFFKIESETKDKGKETR
jgi:hypothetical protein